MSIETTPHDVKQIGHCQCLEKKLAIAREALKRIKDHQGIIAQEARHLSVTWLLADQALKELE